MKAILLTLLVGPFAAFADGGKPALDTLATLGRYFDLTTNLTTVESTDGKCLLTIEKRIAYQVTLVKLNKGGQSLEISLPNAFEDVEEAPQFNDHDNNYMIFFSHYDLTRNGFQLSSGLRTINDPSDREQQPTLTEETDLAMSQAGSLRTVNLQMASGSSLTCTF